MVTLLTHTPASVKMVRDGKKLVVLISQGREKTALKMNPEDARRFAQDLHNAALLLSSELVKEAGGEIIV